MDAMAFTVKGEGTEALDIDIYDVIADSWMGGVSARAVRAAIKNSPAKTINVRINSKGGDVFEGFDIYNQLSQSTAQVEVFIGSLAASSASVIAMAGDRVTMAENAYLMIHDPAGGLIGSAQELRDWADVLDKIRDQIAGTYAARGTIDKSKALELMAAETWLTAKDAKGYGLADEILPLKKGGAKASARAFASLSFRKDEKLPDGLAQTIATARKSITVANLSTSPPLPSIEEVAPVALALVENEEPLAEDGAVPYKSYKLDKAGGWDGAAAESRVRKWASSDGSGDAAKMNWAKYRSAFGWYDAKDAETFGAYKLPHHDVQNGALVTVRAGVIAAGNALAGGRGGTTIPPGDLASVKGHLAKHYREFDIRAPWETKNERATQMTAEEIKQQFPDVHAAILDNGKKAGCAEERDRVTAHLTLGEQSGDMKTALAAIASGDGMTQTLQAKYMAAGMNRQATATRQADSDAAAKVLADAAPPAAADAAAVEDLGDKVVALLEKQLGKGKKVA